MGVVMHFRRLGAGNSQRVDKFEQRLKTFGKIGRIDRPVVHLQVDIDVIVAVPRRFYSFRPEALQIGGQAAGPGTADQQVAAELEIKRGQLRIVLSALDRLKTLVGGPIGGIGAAQIQIDAAEKFLVIGQVRL